MVRVVKIHSQTIVVQIIVRQEPINVADQPIHEAERVFKPGQNSREANPEQQVINPVQEEEEDVLQVQFQEDERRN